MLLYLAGADGYYKHLEGLPNLRFLVSYFYLKDNKGWDLVEWANNKSYPVILDCGAWSAFNKKITLDNKDYIDFCLKYQDKFFDIVALDVINNHQATMSNYLEIYNAGLIDSIPTFHFGTPFEELDKLTKMTNYIGLGGIAQKGRQIKINKWLDYVFTNYPDVKFHGFGATTPELLCRYNWHSIDGTTWMTAAVRYGRIMVNLGNGKIKWIKVQSQSQLTKHWDLVKEIELGWSLKNGRTDRYEEVSTRFNAKSLIEIVDYCTKNKVNNNQLYLL